MLAWGEVTKGGVGAKGSAEINVSTKKFYQYWQGVIWSILDFRAWLSCGLKGGYPGDKPVQIELIYLCIVSGLIWYNNNVYLQLKLTNSESGCKYSLSKYWLMDMITIRDGPNTKI
jgi:hypothetical protein